VLADQKCVETGGPEPLDSAWELAGLVEAEPKVDLDLRRADARDAFRRVFELAKQDYDIDPSVTGGPRVTMVLPHVRLTTAIKALADATGLSCTVTTNPVAGSAGQRYRLRFHVTRMSHSRDAFVWFPGKQLDLKSDVWPGVSPGFDFVSAGAPDEKNLVVGAARDEDHQVVVCPRCGRKITVVRVHSQPRCQKCGRLFQPGWQFCPYDGSPRIGPIDVLKFCPYCRAPLGRHSDDDTDAK